VAATSALGDCQIPIALEILSHHSTPALEQDRAVVEAANTALQRLVGFAPTPSVTEWFRLHRRVYVDKLEIRGASHH
jgi:hypothetical protein